MYLHICTYDMGKLYAKVSRVARATELANVCAAVVPACVYCIYFHLSEFSVISLFILR